MKPKAIGVNRLYPYRVRFPQNNIHPMLNVVISAISTIEIMQYTHHTMRMSR